MRNMEDNLVSNINTTALPAVVQDNDPLMDHGHEICGGRRLDTVRMVAKNEIRRSDC